MRLLRALLLGLLLLPFATPCCEAAQMDVCCPIDRSCPEESCETVVTLPGAPAGIPALALAAPTVAGVPAPALAAPSPARPLRPARIQPLRN